MADDNLNVARQRGYFDDPDTAEPLRWLEICNEQVKDCMVALESMLDPELDDLMAAALEEHQRVRARSTGLDPLSGPLQSFHYPGKPKSTWSGATHRPVTGCGRSAKRSRPIRSNRKHSKTTDGPERSEIGKSRKSSNSLSRGRPCYHQLRRLALVARSTSTGNDRMRAPICPPASPTFRRAVLEEGLQFHVAVRHGR
jgi:hypothetical protein